MDTNFIKQIEEAEARAADLIKAAEAEAKAEIDRNNQLVQQMLEEYKSELIRQSKEKIALAESEAHANVEKSLTEQNPPVISEEKKAEATRQTLERIVNLLGNS